MEKRWFAGLSGVAALAMGWMACSTQATPTANSASPVPEMAARESGSAAPTTPALAPSPEPTSAAVPPSTPASTMAAAPPPTAEPSSAPAASASARLSGGSQPAGGLVQCLDVRAALVRCKDGEKLSHAGCAGPDYMMRCQP